MMSTDKSFITNAAIFHTKTRSLNFDFMVTKNVGEKNKKFDSLNVKVLKVLTYYQSLVPRMCYKCGSHLILILFLFIKMRRTD